MKRINLLGGCLLAVLLVMQPAWAEKPWGLLKETVADTSFNIYAIDNLIGGRPIRYAVSKEVTEKEKNILADNLRAWPEQTLNFIKTSGREKEFADIVPFLAREMELRQVTEGNSPDIYLEIWKTFNVEKTFIKPR